MSRLMLFALCPLLLATPAQAALLAEFTYVQTDSIRGYNGPSDRLDFGFHLWNGPNQASLFGTYNTADVGRVIAAPPTTVALFDAIIGGSSETWIYTSALMDCNGSACPGSHSSAVTVYPFVGDFGRLETTIVAQAVSEMTFFTPDPATWQVSRVEMTIDQVTIEIRPDLTPGRQNANSIGAHTVRFYDATVPEPAAVSLALWLVCVWCVRRRHHGG